MVRDTPKIRKFHLALKGMNRLPNDGDCSLPISDIIYISDLHGKHLRNTCEQHKSARDGLDNV